MSGEERWQLSGNAATIYDRYVMLIMEPWVRRLVDIATLQANERVLDVACGTGFVARLAAQRVGVKGRVVGIDLNPGMIEAARKTDAPTTIDWRIGDAAALPFEDGGFDAVLCQQELQRGLDMNDVDDPLPRIVGCFDETRQYPADRLVLTYPVKCR
jgi:ubiquinone/menaquinone biosynthesis C-methylase UbiE